MGVASSKTDDDVQEEEVIEGSLPSTPILTPKIKTIQELDPRSPSSNVIRTPIETILMKHRDLKDAPPLSVIGCMPRLKYLNTDPRSPSTDFNRTPIVIQSKSDTDLTDVPKKNPVETPNRRKSYVLLETNLDYIETDIDAAYLKNNSRTESTENDKVELGDKCDNMVGADDIKSLEREIETINLNVDIIEKLEKVPDEKCLNNQALLPTNLTDAEIAPKDLTVVINNVKNFDKKLMNLIYEDTDSPVMKRDDSLQIRDRTPLATRNGNMDMRKKVPKLKVTDKPKKYIHQFSKIPVPKQNKRSKVSAQCENTPPTNLRERNGKIRNYEWDADKTVII